MAYDVAIVEMAGLSSSSKEAIMLYRLMVGCLVLVLVWGVPMSAQAESIFVLTLGNGLASFDSATPGTVTPIGTITGQVPGENFEGVDFRPADQQLYGVTDASRLYTINTSTAVATQVGSDGAFTLDGVFFGVDFNPVVDRLRVVSNADQNLRLNPNDGTLTATDTALNPGNPNVVGSAYSNNVAGAASTTLYGIDSAADTLVIQNPPNAGTLATVGAGLGLNTIDSLGFDISGATGVAYAAMREPGGGPFGLYTIDLSTGTATLVGNIGVAGAAALEITGLSVAPAAGPTAIPEPTTMVLLGTGLAALAVRASYKRRTTARR
jgi:hypothetical protein